jgi:hypothetical protein
MNFRGVAKAKNNIHRLTSKIFIILLILQKKKTFWLLQPSSGKTSKQQ